MMRKNSGSPVAKARLRLAMRNYNDDKLVPTSGSDFADLLGAGGHRD